MDSVHYRPFFARKTKISLHAYMFLLKLPMNKWIDAFASLHKAYMIPT